MGSQDSIAGHPSSIQHLRRNLDLLIQSLVIARFGPSTAFRSFPFQSKSDDLALVVVGDVQGSDNDGRGHQIGKEVAVLRLLPGSSRVALFPLLIKRGAPVAILIPLLLELPAVWRAFIVRKGYRL